MIEGLRQLGKTVLLTTHYMDEAERLSDRLAVIADGRIVAEGTATSLREQQAGTLISFRAPPAGILDGLDSPRLDDGRVTIETDEPTRVLHQLTSRAADAGIELEELRVAPVSLEDVYLKLTASEKTPE